ncbi:MAG TPA: molybdenum cofactor guanylyltransferase [Melioribacteraceae bacterium]|nr:molybdenum cofactor guanylyltransferase [Melioribacteraceae bacterium]
MPVEKLRDDVTGVILSGGKSSRMGVNKSLLLIDNIPLIQIIYERMKKVFSRIIISTNEPELYDFLDAGKVEDTYKGFGPLGGIHSSLSFSRTERIFVVSADMPFLLPDLFRFLLDVKSEEEIVVPGAENRIQFLCGIYGRRLIPIAESILSASREAIVNNKELIRSSLSLWNFAERTGFTVVDVSEKIFYMKDLFFNINTPEDFEYVKERLI